MLCCVVVFIKCRVTTTQHKVRSVRLRREPYNTDLSKSRRYCANSLIILLACSGVQLHDQRLLKVKPYSMHGSFLKLEYLKTEFNDDNGTYAIAKVTYHSCQIIVNLPISGYFKIMWHP